MGQKYRSGRSPDEVMLMPADPRDWLPPGHLAWKVLTRASTSWTWPGSGATGATGRAE